MGMSALNNAHVQPLLDTVIAETRTKNEFSLCLRATSGGLLAIGGEGAFHAAPVRYTPMTSGFYYSFKLANVALTRTRPAFSPSPSLTSTRHANRAARHRVVESSIKTGRAHQRVVESESVHTGYTCPGWGVEAANCIVDSGTP
jgi:hypothetical protein